MDRVRIIYLHTPVMVKGRGASEFAGGWCVCLDFRSTMEMRF